MGKCRGGACPALETRIPPASTESREGGNVGAGLAPPWKGRAQFLKYAPMGCVSKKLVAR